MADGLPSELGGNNLSIGATPLHGQSLLAGSGDTGAGSSVAVTFAEEFASAPIVTSSNTSSDEGIFVSGVTTTGFTAQSATASQVFHWQAVGERTA